MLIETLFFGSVSKSVGTILRLQYWLVL